MDCTRDKLFARAACAAHEHRRVARRHLADLLVHGAHLAAVAEQVAGVRGEHVAQTAVLRHERVALLALLQAHRRRLAGNVRDDLQQRHVPVEGFRREIRRVGPVHGQRADHLPEVDKRHAHERDRTRPAARARAVEETTVRMHVRHHLRAARLRHPSRDTLTQTIMPVRLLLRVQTTRRLNRKFVSLQQRERATAHVHTLLENTKNIIQQRAHIALPHKSGANFLKNSYLR